jgi:penicillin-binding protein 1A
MRQAVKDRPVEQFDTEVHLPEWQLEPDEEYFFGDPDEYYFIDEQGNLIEPGRREQPGGLPFPIEGEQLPNERLPRGEAGQAASDDFLERAIGDPPLPGREGSRREPPMPRTIRPDQEMRDQQFER